MDISDIKAYGEFTITISETTEHVWRGTFDDMPDTIKAKVLIELDDADDDADVTEAVSAIIDNDASLSALVADMSTSVENQAFSLEEIV